MPNLSVAREVAALKAHRGQAPSDMRAAFRDDPDRFQKFSRQADGMLLDWSKCSVNDETMTLLTTLARAAGVEDKRDAMFSGGKINITENRAVLHIALRAPADAVINVDGENVVPYVHEVLDKMSGFSDGIRSGELKGATGQAITDVVNIGIGGSDLGPAMAVLALAPYHDGPRGHFVSNVDGAHIHDVLKPLDPATTLIIVASKTFTTIETMTNAEAAKRWIVAALGEDAVGAHFAAVSTALKLVEKFGIGEDRVFGFRDWVGGRYSLWGAIGLPIMLAIGPQNFRDFLAGAHAMDKHFQEAPLEENLPALLGLVGWWHRVACEYPARAVIPYDQRLSRFPAYLQQLDMESNGKSVTIGGEPAATPTGPLVWGEPGTNGQHAFFQLLHQGTDVIPVEFIAAAKGHEPDLKYQHDLLLANVLAQGEALMKGRTLAEAKSQMLSKGVDAAQVEEIAPHRVFAGNRPSITILYHRLDPFTFGRLIALYEHRVFTEGVIFGINSFDQWGVELGKELATGLQAIVEGKEDPSGRDASTAGLVRFIHAAQ